MPSPRLLAAFAAIGVLAAFLIRRRLAGRRTRMDLYFADGSMVSLSDDSPEAQRLLPLAREILSTARA